MPKVKFLSNAIYDGRLRKMGEVVDVDDTRVSQWTKTGLAELVEDKPKKAEAKTKES